MRKYISVFLIVAMFFGLQGCSSSAKPESTVSSFIEAAKIFDFDTMATKVNPANTNNKEKISDLIEDEEDQFQKYFLEYLKSNAAKITYKIKDTKIENNNSVVTVDFKYINGGPLLLATIGEVFSQMMPLAFSGVEITDEQTNQLFVSAMQKQRDAIPETYLEKTVDIKCIKVDGKWYIDDPSDELLDVIMSNFVSASQELGEAFSSDSNTNDTPNTAMGQAEADNMTVIQKGIGDEITLATIKLKVNSVEEKESISSSYGSPQNAKEAAKFVVLNLELTNITNKSFAFSTNLIVVDNKGREFNTYSDTIGNIDNYLNYRDLAPSIKEKGYLVFELPTDATSYNLVVGKAGTNELYQILLK